MRLNPFSKKSSGGYYARIKAEFEPLERELNKARREAADAERARNDAQSYYNDLLAQHDGNWRVPVVEQAVRVLNEAKRHYEEVDYTARHLYDKVRPLREIVEAPAKYQAAQQALKELAQTDQRTRAERERLQDQIAKIEARLAKAEVKVKEETLAASQQWADSTDSDEAAQTAFAPPAALMQAEIEVRMAKTSLEALQQQLQAVDASRVDLPQARHDARRAYQYARYLVSDIEMREQLEPLLPVIARATSAAYDWSPYLEQRKYVIKLSDELVAQASRQLDAELEQL